MSISIKETIINFPALSEDKAKSIDKLLTTMSEFMDCPISFEEVHSISIRVPFERSDVVKLLKLLVAAERNSPKPPINS